MSNHRPVRLLRAKLLWASCAFAMLVLPLDAAAQDNGWLDGTPRAQMIMLLNGFEHVPTLQELKGIGVDLEETLISVASDAAVPQVARGRAINAMADLPGERTRAFASDFLARGADDNLFLMGRTLDLVGGRFAADQPVWAANELAAFVNHDDPTIREFVVKGLGAARLQPEAAGIADDALLQMVIGERNPAVKAELKRALAVKPELKPSRHAPIRKAL